VSASASFVVRRANCLFSFLSPLFLSFSASLFSLLSLFNHTLMTLQVYKAKEKSTGRLVALKKTRLEVSKERRFSSTGERRQLSLLLWLESSARLARRNGRGGDRVETESSSSSVERDGATLSLSPERAH
jgi:hypothetical protein